MSFWDHFFDNDYRQRDDIEALKTSVAMNTTVNNPLRRNIRLLATRLERQELLLAALCSYLEKKNLLDGKELDEHLLRVDLADGVEDGRVGPDKSSDAPRCPFCGHPRNPERGSCVFCGMEITSKDLKLLESKVVKKEKPLRLEYVRCHKCFKRVPKDQAVERMEGNFCRECR